MKSEKEKSAIPRNVVFVLRLVWAMASSVVTLFNLAWLFAGEISILMGLSLLAVVPVSGAVVIGLEYGLKKYATRRERLA